MRAAGRPLLISTPVISWVGSRLPWRRVTRITFTLRHNQSSEIATEAAEALRAVRLVPGPRPTEAQVGRLWRVHRVAHLGIAKPGQGIIRRTGTTKELLWIRMILSASFSILSTSGSQLAQERLGTM